MRDPIHGKGLSKLKVAPFFKFTDRFQDEAGAGPLVEI